MEKHEVSSLSVSFPAQKICESAWKEGALCWKEVLSVLTCLHFATRMRDKNILLSSKRNRSSMIPCDLQDALLCEYQTIRSQCTHIHVSARHEFWSQHYQQLEQYRQQVIDLVGERQADDILLSLYFGGRTDKRKRFFRLRMFISWISGKAFLDVYIDKLERTRAKNLYR